MNITIKKTFGGQLFRYLRSSTAHNLHTWSTIILLLRVKLYRCLGDMEYYLDSWKMFVPKLNKSGIVSWALVACELFGESVRFSRPKGGRSEAGVLEAEAIFRKARSKEKSAIEVTALLRSDAVITRLLASNINSSTYFLSALKKEKNPEDFLTSSWRFRAKKVCHIFLYFVLNSIQVKV